VFLTRLIYSLLMHLLHKTFAVAIALLGFQSAHADWKIIGTFPAGTYYIEANTLQKNGVIRDFWTMLDYPVVQKSSRGATYLSTRSHMQMDCKNQTVHILQFSMHSCRAKSLISRASCANGNPFRRIRPWSSICRRSADRFTASPSQPVTSANRSPASARRCE
jgi:hypothetical protein